MEEEYRFTNFNFETQYKERDDGTGIRLESRNTNQRNKNVLIGIKEILKRMS